MLSRLFHAVVLVGVSLGSAGCGSDVTEGTALSSDSHGDAATHEDVAPSDTGTLERDAANVATDVGTHDVGTPRDVSVGADAVAALDVGTHPDAGPALDAGTHPDAGTHVDVVAVHDAGAVHDALEHLDTGAPLDANEHADTGDRLDAGAAHDATAPRDALADAADGEVGWHPTK